MHMFHISKPVSRDAENEDSKPSNGNVVGAEQLDGARGGGMCRSWKIDLAICFFSQVT